MSITPAFVTSTIDCQAKALVDALNSNMNAQCGVAVAFCYPGQDFEPYYNCGYADGTTKVTEATIFGIGSVTKTFTAALLANAVLTAKAGYGDSVTKHLPAGTYTPLMQAITLEQLATHTSGMRDAALSLNDAKGLFQSDTSTPPTGLTTFWQKYPEHYEHYQPGSCWLYSDLGFLTLGYAMVKACGYQSYADLLQSVITGPLALPNTAATIRSGAPIAQGHYNGNTVAITGSPDLKSCAVDMYQWMLQLLSAPGLNQPSTLMQALAATTEPVLPSRPQCDQQKSGPNMGLAWEFSEQHGAPPVYIWKDGATGRGGCSCWIGMIPASEPPGPMGIAVLANGWFKQGNVSVAADGYGIAMLTTIARAA
jgi:CubicO group peptidase (beta-lactamase class C family)